MATTRRQALENDPRLRQFLIRNVRRTGRVLGSGAYGSVEELEIDGAICAGKRIHEILLEMGNYGVQTIVQKYVEECQLLSQLRHPHIVQFIGVCFLPDSSLPVLIMELLPTSLDDLLENTPDIPLALKRSILADVSKGLVYLHNHDPPIIHRDLSAKNILLNSAMVAKISDMGNSRVVLLQPGQLAQTLSRIPGTMVYMPPEAFMSTSVYGTRLDIFSFGCMALFTLIQVFPGNLRRSTYPNPNNPSQLLALSEVERRGDYIDQLHQQLGERHPMVQLVKECLENNPRNRPPANVILQRLEGMRITDPYQHLTKVEVMQLLKAKDSENQSLQSHLQQLQLQTPTPGVRVTAAPGDRVPAGHVTAAPGGHVPAGHVTAAPGGHVPAGHVTVAHVPETPEDHEIPKGMRQVRRFIVRATPTGKQLGSGAYGCVVELLINGSIFAGKRFRSDACISQEAFYRKFTQEYLILSTLQHPHIVEYRGICFLPDSNLPVLVMERMDTSLSAYLLDPESPNLSLAAKVSILQGIAKGLIYLHSENIIHRDLTAKNVLLNSALVPKISDFGNSGIVEMDPSSSLASMTSTPGTLVYLPPEACYHGARYNEKLDIFSFGHLSIFVATQVFPYSLLPPTFVSGDGILLARTEIDRRREYLDLLGDRHPLTNVIKQCLQNNIKLRPSACDLLLRLQALDIHSEPRQ